MSGGSLPKTGAGAVTLGGGVLGLEGSITMPREVAIVGVAIGVILLGSLLVRLGWRRGRPAGQ
ncbi:hypothetical protein JD77_02667 [Micromonospora olivasterospora]|uniref:Uncharacterized protein n=2 Tax=Micromonospora olivasterospora TaxID=1880 RepID=A0A562I9K7_MICOL|nr:hypothetical protein JD77_02667 [Micromonospora olivasterospora]